MNAHMHMTTFVALSLLVGGGCAIDDDLESLEQEGNGKPVLLSESGTGQDREVMSSFDPLVVTLTDSYGEPLAHTLITFTSPSSGPSAWFKFDGQTTTDATGRAELRPYANSISGTYTVWAHADGAIPMPFVLTNMAAAPASLTTVAGSHQARKVGMPFPSPLTVEVRDNYGNLVPDAPVRFTAPTTGATTSMSEDGYATTSTDGRAAVFATAGSELGSYTVVANVAGAPSVSFSLSNTATDDAMFPDTPVTGDHVSTTGTIATP